MRLITGLLLVFGLSAAAFAQTAYVTDNLRLGIHQAADTSDRAFRMLESGQEVEVLSRNRNYAQVRLPDGTTGYVKAAYLVEDKPAKLIVDEVRAENDALQNRLAELNAAFSQPAAMIESLESKVSETQAALDEALEANSDLMSRNESLERRQEQYQYTLPMTWVGAALAVVLLAGFLGGLWWTDYRSRKRHGGIRLY
ncbi:MAG: TIGR04211 family SH3 domain-containing protein [Woeseiaceae bacterium]|nr:TIGR04211 family SH3 domain-containing protein [Woeseiaceae bacterium]